MAQAAEEEEPDWVREFVPEQQRASPSPSASESDGGASVGNDPAGAAGAAQPKPGDRVECRFVGNGWEAGIITRVQSPSFWVRYDGFANEYEEPVNMITSAWRYQQKLGGEAPAVLSTFCFLCGGPESWHESLTTTLCPYFNPSLSYYPDPSPSPTVCLTHDPHGLVVARRRGISPTE